jgi:hypothetical protein
VPAPAAQALGAPSAAFADRLVLEADGNQRGYVGSTLTVNLSTGGR